MSAVISNSIRINVMVDGGEKVVFICRRPKAQELSNFLNKRFQTKGTRVKSQLYEAREALIDKILVNVEGAEYEDAAGQVKPLNASTVLSDQDKTHWAGILGESIESWKDLIPMSWKSSAAMTFEDAKPEADDADDREGATKN